VQLQTDQLRGKVTFEQACQELHFRCEAIMADNLLDTKFRPAGRALISTEIKHLDKEKLPCLAKGCEGMIVSFLPLCKGCFLQCKSGKLATLKLRDGLGTAKFNVATSKIEFPVGVPKSRLPGERRGKGARKLLMVKVGETIPALGTMPLVIRGLPDPDAPLDCRDVLQWNDHFHGRGSVCQVPCGKEPSPRDILCRFRSRPVSLFG
jgi:hypothetical protein